MNNSLPVPLFPLFPYSPYPSNVRKQKKRSGSSAGFAYSIGKPDGGVTREEALAHCRALVAATPLPVSADLENCYSDDPSICAETIQLAAETGLAGCSIEDATGRDEEPNYPFDLSVERVEAAVQAVRKLSVPFTLTARATPFL